MEARLRKFNYASRVEVFFEILENGEELDSPDASGWLWVGDLPIMVKSKGCSLNKENLEHHLDHDLTEAEYEGTAAAKQRERNSGEESFRQVFHLRLLLLLMQ